MRMYGPQCRLPSGVSAAEMHIISLSFPFSLFNDRPSHHLYSLLACSLEVVTCGFGGVRGISQMPHMHKATSLIFATLKSLSLFLLISTIHHCVLCQHKLVCLLLGPHPLTSFLVGYYPSASQHCSLTPLFFICLKGSI